MLVALSGPEQVHVHRAVLMRSTRGQIGEDVWWGEILLSFGNLVLLWKKKDYTFISEVTTHKTKLRRRPLCRPLACGVDVDDSFCWNDRTFFLTAVRFVSNKFDHYENLAAENSPKS